MITAKVPFGSKVRSLFPELQVSRSQGPDLTPPLGSVSAHHSLTEILVEELQGARP